MPSAYSNPYGSLTRLDRIKGPSEDERRKGARASQMANVMRLLSSAAPTVGGLAGMGIGAALGGPAGAAIGGGIGQGAGGLLGAGGNMLADEQTRPYEEADLRRRRQLETAQRLLGGV